jgi:DNA-binding response OmpR family regulator
VQGIKSQNYHQPKLLVIEDDKNLREVLAYNLGREGYRVLTAAFGKEGIHLAYTEYPDLIVLDLMLPDLNGFEVCRILRKQLGMPIVMLSARTEEMDKLLGLELGADDYLTKPFSFRELLARVHAQLRRMEIVQTAATKVDSVNSTLASNPQQAKPLASDLTTSQNLLLVCGDLSIDLGQRAVNHQGRPVTLTPKEFELLSFLALSPMQVFSRQELLSQVWGQQGFDGTRTVDVHVRMLRTKLEPDPAQPRFIQTVYSLGYKFGQPVAVRTPV